MPKRKDKVPKKKSSSNNSTKKKDVKVDENKKLKNLEGQLEELKDKHLRLKAEFDNFRRRKSKEISNLLQYEGESVILGFLPIVDDLERIINSSDSSEESLVDGINLVQSKLKKYFETSNIEPFGKQGDKMDPDIHDAMLTQKDDNFDEEVILEVYEKGYTYRDKIIRHAKVIVNKK